MIAVMLVEANELVRSALAETLARAEDLRVTAALGLGDHLLEVARTDPPHVVLLDAEQYGLDAVAAVAQRLRLELPECRVLVVTRHTTAAKLRVALAAGVWGLISTDTSPSHLAEVIRQTVAGERPVDPALAAEALRVTANPLTTQERAVLRLAAHGLPTAEIAKQLFLAVGTVRNYLSRAIGKTGARNRLEAVRRAEQWGWL